jgi:hypothetical protein
VLASTNVGEEVVERFVISIDCLVRRHLIIWLDAVLKAIELSAGVSCLDIDITLANMEKDVRILGLGLGF